MVGAVAEAMLLPQCWIGRKATDLVLKIRIVLKKIHFVAGVQNQKVYVIIGEDGKNLLSGRDLSLEEIKNI